MSHGRQICEFGTVHSQCRCADDTVLHIACPTPEKCGSEDTYVPRHRKDLRLESTNE